MSGPDKMFTPSVLIQEVTNENVKLKHALEVLLARGHAMQQEMFGWKRLFLAAVLQSGGELRLSVEILDAGEVEVSRIHGDDAGETWTVTRKEEVEQ